MKKNIFIHLGVGLFLLLGMTVIIGLSEPTLTHAQLSGGTTETTGGYCAGSWNTNRFSNLGDVVRFVTCFLLRLVVPMIFAIAFVLFLVGMLKFLRSDQADVRKEGRQYMIWAVIAITVMGGIWGLVAILGGTFGIRDQLPQLPGA